MSIGNKENLRLRINKGQKTKEVRKVLQRYNVSLTHISYSTNAQSIFFKGSLLKMNGLEFPAHEVLCLVNELSSIGNLRTELENWFFSNDTIYYLGGNQLDMDLTIEAIA